VYTYAPSSAPSTRPSAQKETTIAPTTTPTLGLIDVMMTNQSFTSLITALFVMNLIIVIIMCFFAVRRCLRSRTKNSVVVKQKVDGDEESARLMPTETDRERRWNQVTEYRINNELGLIHPPSGATIRDDNWRLQLEGMTFNT